MKKITDLKVRPEFVLTDIDDTITDEGRLHADAYHALWRLHQVGIKVIPVTGRPAGWCEMIARFWPVEGVIGENGGLYFRYHNRKMKRKFFVSDSEIQLNRKKLDQIRDQILKEVPGSAVASDQFCRLLDLAIDFCEDVPRLPESAVQKIVRIFEQHGAQAKVSSIHVNGWFGSYTKVTMIQEFLKTEFSLSEQDIKSKCLFSGDSPNDEPMFAHFPLSVGVANILNFQSQLHSLPTYVTRQPGGQGFSELVDHLISQK
ncbi:MAG: HAD-IIB family hydrolase [Bdellovibrionales bacterium]